MRVEHDSIGALEIPSDAYYGIQSYRASHNFQISHTQINPIMIQCFLKVKKAVAEVNFQLNCLDIDKFLAIKNSIDELLKLNLNDKFEMQKYFIIDTYQAGAGTSQNMNINEVIANKANELLGYPLGSYQFIHPNDHVNMSQSTNDIYPTVMRISTFIHSKKLLTELHEFALSLENKALEFDSVIKAGRTHLRDAVPIRLGQEFHAYKTIISRLIELIEDSHKYLRVLGIGGSAVGTGINIPKGYREKILIQLKLEFSDNKIELDKDMFAAMQSQLPLMIYSNALRSLALELIRIFNDLRLLSSGPLTGLAELNLPEVQPGSSIMPGKINPSILEMGNQVCFKVLGNDYAMAQAIQAGQLELNVMMPLMAHLALESTEILSNALTSVRERCIDGITANKLVCEKYLNQTSQIATILNPILGYSKVAELVKESLSQNISIMKLLKDQKLLSDSQIDSLFDLKKMTESNN